MSFWDNLFVKNECEKFPLRRIGSDKQVAPTEQHFIFCVFFKQALPTEVKHLLSITLPSTALQFPSAHP